MYCSKCGSTIADGVTFCTKCGLATYTAPVVAASGGLPAAPTRFYAGFWLRFLAYLIDSIVLGLFTIPIVIGLAMMMGLGAAIASLPRGGDRFAEGFPPIFLEYFSISILVAVGGGWLYHALLESSEWQATAGKKALGLEVTDLSGAKVSFGRASGRYFGKMITQLIPLGVGFILAGVTEKKQALHDMISGCLVLRKG